MGGNPIATWFQRQRQRRSNTKEISKISSQKEKSRQLEKTKMLNQPAEEEIGDDSQVESITIVGAGIVGLVLALALDAHCGIQVNLYEQATAFQDDVGAGMGCYPNGLRVIRDISPDLLEAIQSIGYPYLLRRFVRHDGTEIATASERKLLIRSDGQDQLDDMQSIGLRRWKLQKILYDTAVAKGIKVHFRKRLQSLEQVKETGIVCLRFEDGTQRKTRLLVGADGSKSKVRNLVSQGKYKLQYTNTTCLMGTATVGRQERGLSLPASETTRCHGAFYPTGEHEQCFQFHFPTDLHPEKSDPTRVDPRNFSWGGMTHNVEQEECNILADRLVSDGWDEKFIQPLRNVDKALKIGFSTLEPSLETFVFDRVVLVGDAGHPPVPYLGQGAQQGMEDAGTLALLIKEFCLKSPLKQHSAKIDLIDIDQALTLYDKLRQPQTAEVLDRSKLWGKQQQKRSMNQRYNRMREENIRRDVFYHETLPILLPAVRHDYQAEVDKAIAEFDFSCHSADASAKLVRPVGRSTESPSNIHMIPLPEETACF